MCVCVSTWEPKMVRKLAAYLVTKSLFINYISNLLVSFLCWCLLFTDVSIQWNWSQDRWAALGQIPLSQNRLSEIQIRIGVKSILDILTVTSQTVEAMHTFLMGQMSRHNTLNSGYRTTVEHSYTVRALNERWTTVAHNYIVRALNEQWTTVAHNYIVRALNEQWTWEPIRFLQRQSKFKALDPHLWVFQLSANWVSYYNMPCHAKRA